MTGQRWNLGFDEIDTVQTCRLSAIEPGPVTWTDFVGAKRSVPVRALRKLSGKSHHYGLDDVRTLQRRFSFAQGASPRVFLRVDDFVIRHSLQSFRTFHEIARDNGCPYLLGVTPFPFDRPHADEHLSYLKSIAGEVEIAMHGLTHECHTRRPRSEIAGMAPARLETQLSRARDFFRGMEQSPAFFIPPYNTIDGAAVNVLARNFSVISLGPEMMVQHGPVWPCVVVEGTVLLYSIMPFYGSSSEVLAATEGLDFSRIRFPICVTLHFPVEEDYAFHDLDKMLKRIRPYIRGWRELPVRK